MTTIVKERSNNAVKAAVKVLERGGTIVYPTETSYGLGCDGTSRRAVKKIFRIKGRSNTKNLTYIISSLRVAKEYGTLNKNDIDIIKKLMPGNMTLVVKSRNNIIGNEFAFRISSNKFAHNLARN